MAASPLIAQLVYENFRPRVRRTRKLDRLFPPTYNMPKLIYSRENLLQCEEKMYVEVEITEVIETSRPSSVATTPTPSESNDHAEPMDKEFKKPESRKQKIGKWRRLWNNVIHGRVEKSYQTGSGKKDFPRNGTI